jgi:uncharacterized protein (DUF305 family)
MAHSSSVDRRFVFALSVAATIVIAGSVVGFILGRESTPASPSITFNQAMIKHHTQAVTMAMTLLRRGEDPDLVVVARDIVLTQQAQIGAMGAHLDNLGASRIGDAHPMPGMASNEQIASLEQLPAPVAEVEMLRLMIAHHQGGVSMATDALVHHLDRPTRRLAESIVTSQRNELELLNTLLIRLSTTRD